MGTDVAKVQMAIKATAEDEKSQDKENGHKRKCRPHSAHNFSTRKLSPGVFFVCLLDLYFIMNACLSSITVERQIAQHLLLLISLFYECLEYF